MEGLTLVGRTPVDLVKALKQVSDDFGPASAAWLEDDCESGDVFGVEKQVHQM